MLKLAESCWQCDREGKENNIKKWVGYCNDKNNGKRGDGNV